MTRPLALLVLVLLHGLAPAAEQALDAGMVNPGYLEQPEWFKHSFLDLREDVTEAASEGRRVLLYFHQDGCPYCARLLQDNFGDRAIAEKTRRHFEVISINIWGDREVTDLAGRRLSEKRFAEQLRVQYTPTLLFLDEAGKVVARLNGYYPPHKFDLVLDYVAGRLEKQQRLQDYLASRSPLPASGRLHSEPFFLSHPLRLAQRAEPRPLAVLFEQRACRTCDELHADLLRREPIVTALSNFDLAQVDIRSSERLQTPDGRELPARQWAGELGVQYAPSWVFFDAQGRELFRIEAWLRSFHLHAALDYVASGAYRWQPNFQRFVQRRADWLHDKGLEVNLMK